MSLCSLRCVSRGQPWSFPQTHGRSSVHEVRRPPQLSASLSTWRKSPGNHRPLIRVVNSSGVFELLTHKKKTLHWNGNPAESVGISEFVKRAIVLFWHIVWWPDGWWWMHSVSFSTCLHRFFSSLWLTLPWGWSTLAAGTFFTETSLHEIACKCLA